MINEDLLLIGAGGHARSCIDVIEQEGNFRIAGLVGLQSQLGMKVEGYEVIETDDTFSRLVKKIPFALIVIGQLVSSEKRVRLFHQALEAGFEMARIISPSAHVSSSARIGAGSIVMHGAILNSGVTVGSNCIINSKALIEHDSKVGNDCHISTGAILNGGVIIDEGCFIGSGAVVKEGVTIGKSSVVGMGAILRSNLAASSKFLGESLL